MAYRASLPAAEPPSALEWRVRSEKPLAFSVRVDPPQPARSAAMAALVVAVLAGGGTWLEVAMDCRRGAVLEAPHSLSAGGAVLLYVLSTLGPVLLYQGLARFARRLHVELDSQCFRASVAPLPPSRTAALEATRVIERFAVEASSLRDGCFDLVLRLRGSGIRPWAMPFDLRAHAEFLAHRLNAELAAIAVRSVVEPPGSSPRDGK